VKSALIIGGSGPVGEAITAALVADDWQVTAASRSGAAATSPVRSVRLDRNDSDAVAAAIGDRVDLVVDVAAFDEEHGAQLNKLADYIGSAIVLSSAAVYRDEEGRTFDIADSSEAFPRFPVPIPAAHPTVAGGPETYATRKVALEQTLLDGPLAVTIIRPGAIHGPGAKLPRELFFVKRIVDGRRQVVLVDGGRSRFHTTAVTNLAELTRLAAARPGNRVLNCADPDALTTDEIRAAIAEVLGSPLEPVLVDVSGYDRSEISNPWAAPYPVVLDMSDAERELGYQAVATYEDAVRATCEWLAGPARDRDWAGTYLAALFDYAAEDRVIAELLR
jgi:nucleoside-diphosphate-sugar epimerase